LQAKAHSAEQGFQDQLAHERSRADALTLEVDPLATRLNRLTARYRARDVAIVQQTFLRQVAAEAEMVEDVQKLWRTYTTTLSHARQRAI
jgi:hypothetical protein